MSKEASRESKMVDVVLADGKKGWCDPEIQTLVQALNNAGLKTVASCSGHGHRPATIALDDGREILILRNFEEARSIGGLWNGINGEPKTLKTKRILKQ